MKLWTTQQRMDPDIELFTIGQDPVLDQILISYDCTASIAHAKMLHKIGLLTNLELESALNGLQEIIKLHSQNSFSILPGEEDCHSAIERYLTDKHGLIGKKIHLGRSRNDQVLTALRLYEKEQIQLIINLINKFNEHLTQKKNTDGHIALPGYTHMQRAMPTTIGVWLGSFLAASKDNINLLEAVIKIIDQSPLGSAAGFGVPILNIDREYTAKELNFSSVMENTLYTQLSRGKFEAMILNTLTFILYDLNKFATDLLLFSTTEFGYLSLPLEMCTGSSIMPQKKNADVLELLRAKYHIVLAEEIKVKSIISNLMSGYNRDLQLTKEPLFSSITITKECLSIMTKIISHVAIDSTRCSQSITPELFATEKVNTLVLNGIPFRDAYHQVAKEYNPQNTTNHEEKI